MVSELDLLRALLMVAIVAAPLVTSRFFLETTKLHDVLHGVAAPLAIVALAFDVPSLSFAWPLFCVAAFLIFLHQQFSRLRSVYELAKCVPFAFAIIGATWLASGVNDLGLLGYGEAFSFYAALHGHVLGWMMVGGIAFLANEADRFRRLYIVAVFACFASFLLVAFGIDGAPVIKPIGVTGIMLTVGASQALFLTGTWRTSRPAFLLGLLSLLGFAFTMTVAWQNELGSPPDVALGVRGMVSLHGVVNALVVAPGFVLALHLDRRANRPTNGCQTSHGRRSTS